MRGFGDEWGRHFSVESPPTIVVKPKGRAPFAVTRLLSPTSPRDISESIALEPSFLVSVALKPLRHGSWDHWSDGRPLDVPGIPPLHTSTFDLQASQIAWVRSPFDYLHFNVPKDTVDSFTNEHELPAVSSLIPKICENDHVIANLSRLILPFLDDERERSELFLSHFGMMLCTRLVEGYASSCRPVKFHRGGLAPWQRRRAEELLLNHLDGDLRLDRLARECGLSSGHFARAFKNTFGVSAHRWVVDRRIDRAKALMLHSGLSLVDIAAHTGFSSQSTFSRAFHQRVGHSPGNWRRGIDDVDQGARKDTAHERQQSSRLELDQKKSERDDAEIHGKRD